MKIFGVGIDIVKISRITPILHKTYSKRFLAKVFGFPKCDRLD